MKLTILIVLGVFIFFCVFYLLWQLFRSIYYKHLKPNGPKQLYKILEYLIKMECPIVLTNIIDTSSESAKKALNATLKMVHEVTGKKADVFSTEIKIIIRCFLDDFKIITALKDIRYETYKINPHDPDRFLQVYIPSSYKKKINKHWKGINNDKNSKK